MIKISENAKRFWFCKNQHFNHPLHIHRRNIVSLIWIIFCTRLLTHVCTELVSLLTFRDLIFCSKTRTLLLKRFLGFSLIKLFTITIFNVVYLLIFIVAILNISEYLMNTCPNRERHDNNIVGLKYMDTYGFITFSNSICNEPLAHLLGKS